MKYLPLLVFFMIFLAACSYCSASLHVETEHISHNLTAPDGESISLMWSGLQQLTEDGFFIGGSIIAFHDFNTNRNLILCTQPGCPHSSSLCPAYLGAGSQYALYRGAFYAMNRRIIGFAPHYTFKYRKPSDSTWQILWEHTISAYASSNVVTVLGGGYAVILANEFVLYDVNDTHQVYYNQLISINLETETITELVPRHEITDSASLLLTGVAEGKAVVFWTGFSEEILSHKEFALQALEHGISFEDATNDWFVYLEERRINRILIFNLETGMYSEIASGKGSELLINVMNVVHNGAVFYIYNRTIFSHCLYEETTTELIYVPNLISFFVMDGKIFYTIEVDEHLYFYFYDLETSKTHHRFNEGDTEVMILSIHHENSTAFMGIGANGNNFIIPKDDFYNARYEQAIWLN